MNSSGQNLIELHWEGAAGRQPSRKLVVTITDVHDEGTGFLSAFKNHPSMANSMPDPVALSGSVDRYLGEWSASAVRLVLPKYKLPDVKAPQKVAMGLTAGDVCICVTAVPSNVSADGLADWLQQWECGE